LSWKREKFDDYYRMTQAGSIMIYENTAQNYIYNTKEINKFEGKGKSPNSRKYFA